MTVLRRIATIGIGLAVGALPLLTAPSNAATAPAGAPSAASSTAAADQRARPRISLRRWSTTRQWRSGTTSGVRVSGGTLSIGRPVDTRVYRDPYGSGKPRRYDVSRWASRWVQPDFAPTELIPSWKATTQPNTWIEVSLRARAGSRVGSWDVLGRWANNDRGFHRSSGRSQADDLTRVNVDTLVGADGVRLTGWQVRVALMRRVGTDASPRVRSLGAVASRVPDRSTVQTSATSMRATRSLRVPRYSQMVHSGDYPQWNNGGEAWCSPTSTAMILGFWDRLPSTQQYDFVPAGYPQPWVVHATRFVFDYRYDGAGNWPFNTAYAATRGLDAHVTRLRSLREAEAYIRKGIPLVASIAFGPGELGGSPINSSAGHVLVIRGFTKTGDVLANDPAAATRKGVPRTYDRGQFENAWIPASGGVVYVLRPAGTPLP